MSETFDTLRDMIAETLCIAQDGITLEASFKDDLGMDSLDAVELVFLVEEGFGVCLDDEELEKVKTVGDALALIERSAA